MAEMGISCLTKYDFMVHGVFGMKIVCFSVATNYIEIFPFFFTQTMMICGTNYEGDESHLSYPMGYTSLENHGESIRG